MTNLASGVAARFPDGTPHPDGLGAGAGGQLIYGGGTAFASASNPSAEVIDGTGVTSGRSNRVTLDPTNGTLEALDPGDYDVEVDLADFSSAAASGNVQLDVQYAPDGVTFAAFGTTEATGGGGRMQAVRAAATAKAGVVITKRQHLNGGGKVRAVLTSAAGGIQTVTEGALSIRKVADDDPPFLGR
jgi:hypothetical protein